MEATKIKLETYACNEASFRVPDCDGWQPQEEPISQSHPFKSKLITEVPVRVIAGACCFFNAGYLATEGEGIAAPGGHRT